MDLGSEKVVKESGKKHPRGMEGTRQPLPNQVAQPGPMVAT